MSVNVGYVELRVYLIFKFVKRQCTPYCIGNILATVIAYPFFFKLIMSFSVKYYMNFLKEKIDVKFLIPHLNIRMGAS